MSLNYISKLYSQCIYQRKTLSSSYQRVSSNPPPSTTRYIVAETHENFLQCLESRLVCHISCFWLYTRVLMMQFINTFEGVKTRCVCKADQTLFSATTNINGKKGSGHARLGTLMVDGTSQIFTIIRSYYILPQKCSHKVWKIL